MTQDEREALAEKVTDVMTSVPVETKADLHEVLSAVLLPVAAALMMAAVGKIVEDEDAINSFARRAADRLAEMAGDWAVGL